MKHLSRIIIAVIIILFSACSKNDDCLLNEIQEEKIFSEKIISENEITIDEARQNLENLLKDFSSLGKKEINSNFTSQKITNGFTLTSTGKKLSKSSSENSRKKNKLL
ncbi:MAG: hypothetical protein IKQ46_06465 [Bacteroidales bacterium]|nr:hypothetical protein [Bacteroidales bacterium]